jgi:hypothetical protein
MVIITLVPSTPTEEITVRTPEQKPLTLARLCREMSESVSGLIPPIPPPSWVESLENAVMDRVNRHIVTKTLGCSEKTCRAKLDCCAAFVLASALMGIIQQASVGQTQATILTDKIGPGLWAKVQPILEEEGFACLQDDLYW